MHFEVLIEDASGRIVVDHVLNAIFESDEGQHTWKIHAYKGLGRLPKDLKRRSNPSSRQLLEQLPRVLRGYGRALHDSAAVVVVVDLDDRDCESFKRELLDILQECSSRPTTIFRIAIEEIEAWLLGDREAVETAYPDARKAVLDGYVQDSICGTWELLADAVHAGGSNAIKKVGWPAAGEAKCRWAERIGPKMKPDRNRSPSFRAFRDGVRDLAAD